MDLEKEEIQLTDASVTDEKIAVTNILNEEENELENAEFEYENDAEIYVEDKHENYKYTEIDCLDEDDVISDQIYVLLSFISPERIMNCNMRGIKVRGVFSSREKAEKKLQKLKAKDKYFDIYLGEVGKWLPLNPTMNQVEEVKYRNKKLGKIMDKVHKTELEQLNELVGRRKDQLDKEKVAHKDRIKNSVKEAVRTYNDNPDGKINSQEVEKKPEKKQEKISNQRDPEAVKQRLRRIMEQRAANKNVLASNNNNNINITENNNSESTKINELKTTSDEIEGKLNKMKEFMKNRQNSASK